MSRVDLVLLQETKFSAELGDKYFKSLKDIVISSFSFDWSFRGFSASLAKLVSAKFSYLSLRLIGL